MNTIQQVSRDIWINAAPERVWTALTVPEERNKWETRSSKIDLVIGGIIQLDYGWGVTYEGIITELDRPHRIVTEDADKELMIWSIEPQDGGCRVTISYTGLWSGDRGMMMMENMLFGTYQFMRNMKQVLEHEEDMRSSYWRSWIGMNHRTIPYLDTTAVQVVQVIPNTPAYGILQELDILIQLNGKPIHNYEELEQSITEMESNGDIHFQLIRQGQPCYVSMKTIPYGARFGTNS